MEDENVLRAYDCWCCMLLSALRTLFRNEYSQVIIIADQSLTALADFILYPQHAVLSSNVITKAAWYRLTFQYMLAQEGITYSGELEADIGPMTMIEVVITPPTLVRGSSLLEALVWGIPQLR